MSNKKSIYTILFCSSNKKYTVSGTGIVPVKAINEDEAKSKFLKKYKGLTEEDNIMDCSLLEPDHRQYYRLSSFAIL